MRRVLSAAQAVVGIGRSVISLAREANSFSRGFEHVAAECKARDNLARRAWMGAATVGQESVLRTQLHQWAKYAEWPKGAK